MKKKAAPTKRGRDKGSERVTRGSYRLAAAGVSVVLVRTVFLVRVGIVRVVGVIVAAAIVLVIGVLVISVLVTRARL